MLNPDLIPTRLIKKVEQKPVPIKEPAPPAKWRVAYLVARFIRLAMILAWLLVTRRLSNHELAVRLRKEFEHLGGLWLKLGQLLSLRSDVFSAEFCTELAHLQDKAEGFPPKMAREIIESEMKRTIEDVFEVFEEKPFAAASIGQIHRAKLKREKAWVAVKVQRPFAADAFVREMAVVKVAVTIVRYSGLVPNLHWEEMLWELSQILAEETDFHCEAGSMRRMRKNLKKHDIYVPKVFSAYCTGRVLVSEYLEAALMSDFIRMSRSDPKRLDTWCRENDIDKVKVAKRLFRSLWRQLLEDDIFHADMHPGNIILLRQSRLALIDFGAVGSMEREYQQRYTMMMQAMVGLDYSKAADLLFLLSGALPPTDLTEGKQMIIRALRKWYMSTYSDGLPYSTRSMSNVANELVKILFMNECSADWSFLRITRAQETVDQSLMHLHPMVNYSKWTAAFFMRFAVRRYKAAVSRQAMGRYVGQVVECLTLPERISEAMTFQSWVERRKALVFQGTSSKFATIIALLFARFTFAMGVLAAYFFLLFLHQHYPTWIPGLHSGWLSNSFRWFTQLDLSVWLLLGFLAMMIYQTSRKISHQLAMKERSGD